jgi:hypothetical protein
MAAAALGSAHESARSPPPLWLRGAVREVLERAPGYQQLPDSSRKDLAQAMVKVSALAADLIAEENQAHLQAFTDAEQATPAPLARAQEAPEFGTATDRIASTTRNVLGAVSFPRFVTDLVNGVFKSMLDSTAQQMKMYVELLNNVSASAAGFERTQFSTGAVRQWLAEQFPDQIAYQPPDQDPDFPPDPEEEPEETRLTLRNGGSMPDAEALRAVLGLQPGEALDASSPEQLVPLARRQIARQRQQMLATMVMLGMQRIVIDSGRINASMRFHIDTRSAASEDRASRFGVENRVRASGSFGVGPWGVSADVQNTISYVSTQQSQRSEEINTELDLNSSVELNFHTDYLPLNQMAAQAQADRIRNATLNPAATPDPAAGRQARQAAQVAAEQNRRSSLDASLRAPVGSHPSDPLPIPVRGGQASGATPGATSRPAAGSTPGATPPAPAASPPAASQPAAAPPAAAQPAASAPAAARTPVPPATATPPAR